MMLKTVYGPPPVNMERMIEAAEGEGENCIREQEAAPSAKTAPGNEAVQPA